jgi:signal transduction histidine kinase
VTETETQSATLAELRPIDLFDDLSDAELQRWVDVTRMRDITPGELIAEQGEAPAGLTLLVSGEVRSLIVDGANTEPMTLQHAPTWMGAIAVLTGGTQAVRMEVATPGRAGLVAPDDMMALVFEQPVVHRRIMSAIRPVMSRLAGIERNREHLASLGTMAAGLAHELNNPAAAAQRSAAQMADALDVLASSIGRFVESGIEREEAEELVALQRGALAQACTLTALDTLDAADAEDELVGALEELGVPEPWELGEPLAAAGLDRDWVARVHAIAGDATGGVLRWVAASLTARSLAADLAESTQRMSDLVSAVKSYAYMDRGALVTVDLHEGLETTLTVLHHKLKQTQIEVVRDYDRELPPVTVYGSELNQVWTNLIDNAIGALGDTGTITLTTRRDGDCAVVSVTDDGPGIDSQIRDRVFEPFFTTKGVGEGTGLGLDTARRIIADRHGGSLSFESQPGRTTFTVRMPLTQEP